MFLEIADQVSAWAVVLWRRAGAGGLPSEVAHSQPYWLLSCGFRQETSAPHHGALSVGMLNFPTAWQLIFPQSIHPRESKIEATCLLWPTLKNTPCHFDTIVLITRFITIRCWGRPHRSGNTRGRAHWDHLGGWGKQEKSEGGPRCWKNKEIKGYRAWKQVTSLSIENIKPTRLLGFLSDNYTITLWGLLWEPVEKETVVTVMEIRMSAFGLSSWPQSSPPGLDLRRAFPGGGFEFVKQMDAPRRAVSSVSSPSVRGTGRPAPALRSLCPAWRRGRAGPPGPGAGTRPGRTPPAGLLSPASPIRQVHSFPLGEGKGQGHFLQGNGIKTFPPCYEYSKGTSMAFKKPVWVTILGYLSVSKLLIPSLYLTE